MLDRHFPDEQATFDGHGLPSGNELLGRQTGTPSAAPHQPPPATQRSPLVALGGPQSASTAQGAVQMLGAMGKVGLQVKSPTQLLSAVHG